MANAIDLIAILPFYFEKCLQLISGGNGVRGISGARDWLWFREYASAAHGIGRSRLASTR
eukprot:1182390-Prorocentrum_minimum.AAC.2